jgi:protein TonB
MIRKLSLDQAEAQVLSRKQPVYPPIAIAAAVKGEVVVRVFVATTGIPATVKVASGPAMLQGAAIEAARGWTFKPLMAGTRPIGFQTDIIFDFATAGVGRGGVKSKP